MVNWALNNGLIIIKKAENFVHVIQFNVSRMSICSSCYISIMGPVGPRTIIIQRKILYASHNRCDNIIVIKLQNKNSYDRRCVILGETVTSVARAVKS